MTAGRTDHVQAGIATLRQRLEACIGRDRPEFRRRLRGISRRAAAGRPCERAIAGLAREMDASVQRRAARMATLPEPSFPEDLPLTGRLDAIREAIADHQVVVVCGETGSGKSTQLPKICLSLGRGVDGMIAHTQPRRLAARTLASRIAEELDSQVGEAVGYKVRFTDRVGPRSYIKLLTDGMLLAEIQGDRRLEQYDTIIIDEAHERSLNIDFLLGYLRQLLPHRPDLKVLITSATIDPERFSRHFDNAPIIEVSGRTYPVEVRYRPLAGDDDNRRDRDMVAGVVEAVDELAGEGNGDVLVFLPTERDIRDTAEALRKHHPPHTEVLPLYARLSAAEQQRVFAPHRGRRIVLSTNVAETSVTVPGIRYVVDTGMVRMSRYSYRTKVQRLPLEPVSQASARQRAGRCGRLAPGICIRLYGEEDFLARPEYTDPEILRTNLAAVILQMEAQRLGTVEEFPFVEPPDRRYVNDGYRLLYELGAVDDDRHLTEIGRRLARLPVDPAIGRMLLAAADVGALAEVLVVAAALSIPDPRERPMDARQAADQAHAAWKDLDSDFSGFLHLWRDYRAAARSLSRNKLRGWAREHYLSFARLRDWDDIYRQLREVAGGMGPPTGNREPADAVTLHRALLPGLLGSVAMREEGDTYIGARDLRLTIFPGSGLARRRPKWIVAAELVETSRVFARVVAATDPKEVECVAGHLVRRSYSDPHWDRKRGEVRAFETVSLYGLVLVPRRSVNYGRVDPADAREIFLRQGLAEDRVDSRGDFIDHNRRLIAELQRLEAKARRRDVLVDAEARYAFFAGRLPHDIHDLRGFERWRRKAERDEPGLLRMRTDDLMQRDAAEISGERFPDRLTVGGLQLPLEYHFEPGHEEDGVTVTIPLAALNQVGPEAFEWLVPGLLGDKIASLIRALPKRLRRNFVPAPEFARALRESLPVREGSLLAGMRQELRRMTGVDVPPEEWDRTELPSHLRMRYRVLDTDGRTLAAGRDLAVLQADLSGEAARAGRGHPDDSSGWDRDGITRWEFGDIPQSVEYTQQGIGIRAYPALEDCGTHVRQVLVDSEATAASLTRGGVRRLVKLALRDQVRLLERRITANERMQLCHAPLGGSRQLVESLVNAIIDRTVLADGVPRSEGAFEESLAIARGRLVDTGEAFMERIAGALERFHALRKGLKGPRGLEGMDSFRDMSEQLDHLVYAGFIDELPAPLLDNLPRYLEALAYRLEKYRSDPARDSARTRMIRPWWEDYLRRAALHRREGIIDPGLLAFRLMLEEYRISLFAQPVGASMPVSEKRLRAQWKAVR